jgi:small-conductance mechanosensitive channel
MTWIPVPPTWAPVIQYALAVVLLVGIATLLYVFVSRMLGSMQKRHMMSEQLVVVLRSAARWLLVVVVLLLFLQYAGVLQNVWAVIVGVAGMVAIGFVAVWSVLSNAMCTVFLLVFQPFRIGDDVEIPADGVAGKAVDINFMYTTLRSEDGYDVRIPNNSFFQKVLRRREGKVQRDLQDQLHRQEEG